MPLTVQFIGASGHFVSPTGNNGNPGTFAEPWLTIAYAVSQLVAGDILYIRAGTYQETFTISADGTAVAPIVVRSYPGETAIVDGNNYAFPGEGGNLVTVAGDYIQVRELEVRYSGYGGIYVNGNYNLVTNCYVHHSWQTGIYISGEESGAHDNIVEYNRVTCTSMFNENNGGGGTSSSLTAANGAVSNIIRHNTVWENWGEGISVYSTEGPNTVEDNIVHDCFTNIYISDADHTLCQRNISYLIPTSPQYAYEKSSGIIMGDEKFSTYGNSHGNKVINNLIYGCRFGIWWWAGAGDTALIDCVIANNTSVNSQENDGEIVIAAPAGTGAHSGNVIRNNICRQDNTGPVAKLDDPAGITIDHNCWSKTAPANCQGTGDVTGDPLLAETDDFDNPLWFKLLSGSPARGAGLAVGDVQDDYWGTPRSDPPDMGAHEYVS